MDHALPATTIDLIRDGARRADLKAHGDGAVWSALVRTASSAQQRGWTYVEWADLVTATRSTLGRQVALRDGSKQRTRKSIEATMRSAWTASARWLADAPPPITREDVEAKARALRDLIADPDVDIRDTDRAILAFAASEATRLGTDRPTLPLRAISAGTCLSIKAVRVALARLGQDRLLVCEVKGTPCGPAAKRARASAYRLPDPSVLEARKPAATEEDDVAKITIDMASLTPEQRRDLLVLLGRDDADAQQETPGNVVPLRRRTA